MSVPQPLGSSSIPCYFCTESFEESLLQEHLFLCGSVLQECTKKCGAYFPRRSLRHHEKYCTRIHHPEYSSLPRNYRMASDDSKYHEKLLSLLNVLRATLREAESERQHIMTDTSLVKTRLANMESISKSIQADLSTEANTSRRALSFLDKRINTLDDDLRQVEGRTRVSFDAVTHRLDVVQGALVKQRNKQLEMLSNCEMEIKDLKKFVARESVLIGDVWDEHKIKMNDLKLELEMRCKASEELAGQHEILSEKLETLVEIIGKQEGMIKCLKDQVMDVVKCVEDIFIKDERDSRYSTISEWPSSNGVSKGRLLWRIDKYKEKMTAAKESDAVIFSPVFFDREYGYALRMKLYLNGRDRWRDRNVIGCLQVVEGPWDPLLDWPCVLRASVTLRDQDNPANSVRKIVKTRATSREGEGHVADSVIDMFIPHTVLTRYDGYTRNNALFLDIQVTEIRESLSTSSLIA
ncbi:TNF receptor-associated factor 3 [Fopius arisanus]|uniref:TNF receptor-associated factor 3 n=1 Tax=Fopius arisanus TaxID=64838 RepID=A0A9R1TTN0_9HYME|nr:PREDICTED: TNF receptor-associated factor 3 [Fopius arisanus]